MHISALSLASSRAVRSAASSARISSSAVDATPTLLLLRRRRWQHFPRLGFGGGGTRDGFLCFFLGTTQRLCRGRGAGKIASAISAPRGGAHGLSRLLFSRLCRALVSASISFVAVVLSVPPRQTLRRRRQTPTSTAVHSCRRRSPPPPPQRRHRFRLP